MLLEQADERRKPVGVDVFGQDFAQRVRQFALLELVAGPVVALLALNRVVDNLDIHALGPAEVNQCALGDGGDPVRVFGIRLLGADFGGQRHHLGQILLVVDAPPGGVVR